VFLSDSYRLISYDQRGSGRSTVVTDPARLTLEHHVDDVDAVRRHFGFERMVLVGHSWGAAPSAFYAFAHPERVAALVLVDPMPMRRGPWMQQFGENLRKWMDEPTAKRVDELAVARRNAPDPVAACRAYWAVFLRGYLSDPQDLSVLSRMRGDVCNDPPVAISNIGVVSRAALGPLGDWDWRDRFRNVNVPVLIVHGAKDPIPIESAAEWQKAFPQATLVPIDDAGHFPQVEQPVASIARPC
jgi:proline iminopeptidase